MEYYSIINLKKEPFSNSPEPEFLFQSPQYTGCLQKLELAIRLRRGLNVIIGDIGTGKTTLCRKLIQNFSSSEDDAEIFETHLLLDPAAASSLDFLLNVASILGIRQIDVRENEWQVKEKIKDYLFNKGVTEGKIVVLVIDEGQKIPENCLEILREFLNYETNDFKLLQIVIFAQEEFKAVLKKRPNLTDRINIFYYLRPLNFSQMREMINYRISVARNLEKGPALFTFLGLVATYISTGGYPRKVVSLCHQVILMLIIRGKEKAGFIFVRKCLNEMAALHEKKIRWSLISPLIFIGVCFSAAAFFMQYQNTKVNKLTDATATVSQVTPANTIVISQSKENALVQPTIDSKVKSVSFPDITDLTKPNYKLPEYLGTLTLRKGRTLWWMLHNVYGDTGTRITQALMQVNPHIENINKLESGKIIKIPLIPSGVKPVKSGQYLVQIKEGKSMEDVYSFFRENPYQQKISETIFFSSWNKTEGMIFSVVLDKCFADSNNAQNEINKLPSQIAANAKILSQWDEDTLFFNRHIFKCINVSASGG